jgi:hypothetical protein
LGGFEYHEQPIVAVRLMIAAGAERDPATLPEWPVLPLIS